MPSALTPGQGGPVPEETRNQLLYPINDPQQAMIAAMKARGINPFRSNPFIQSIMQAAPGLVNAWMLHNVGANLNDINANGGIGQMLGQFLQGEIGRGSIFNTLNQTRQNLPGYASQLQGLEDRLGAGDTSMVANLPPFLGALTSQMMSPRGLADVLSSLAAPGLGGLGQSYTRGINQASQGAWNSMISDQNLDLSTAPTFFDYVLNNGGSRGRP